MPETRKKTDEELERRGRRALQASAAQNRGSFNEGLKSKYEAIRKRAQEAAFGHLTDKDWESLDRKWKKFAAEVGTLHDPPHNESGACDGVSPGSTWPWSQRDDRATDAPGPRQYDSLPGGSLHVGDK